VLPHGDRETVCSEKGLVIVKPVSHARSCAGLVLMGKVRSHSATGPCAVVISISTVDLERFWPPRTVLLVNITRCRLVNTTWGSWYLHCDV
jgi:hypothetical protein